MKKNKCYEEIELALGEKEYKVGVYFNFYPGIPECTLGPPEAWHSGEAPE